MKNLEQLARTAYEAYSTLLFGAPPGQQIQKSPSGHTPRTKGIEWFKLRMREKSIWIEVARTIIEQNAHAVDPLLCTHKLVHHMGNSSWCAECGSLKDDHSWISPKRAQ